MDHVRAVVLLTLLQQPGRGSCQLVAASSPLLRQISTNVPGNVLCALKSKEA